MAYSNPAKEKVYQREYYLLNKKKRDAYFESRDKVLRRTKPWTFHLKAVRQRCNNPNHTYYKNYGAKGIKCFLTEEQIKTLWVRDKASKLKLPSIDREDSKGHYTFDNCRFIEKADNTKRRFQKCSHKK